MIRLVFSLQGPSSLQSKSKSTIIMCFGADTVISVTPKCLSLSGPSVFNPSAAVVEDDHSHLDPASRDEDDPTPDEDLDAEADTTSPAAPKPAHASVKLLKPIISTTLAHGDDFDVCILSKSLAEI